MDDQLPLAMVPTGVLIVIDLPSQPTANMFPAAVQLPATTPVPCRVVDSKPLQVELIWEGDANWGAPTAPTSATNSMMARLTATTKKYRTHQGHPPRSSQMISKQAVRTPFMLTCRPRNASGRGESILNKCKDSTDVVDQVILRALDSLACVSAR